MAMVPSEGQKVSKVDAPTGTEKDRIPREDRYPISKRISAEQNSIGSAVYLVDNTIQSAVSPIKSVDAKCNSGEESETFDSDTDDSEEAGSINSVRVSAVESDFVEVKVEDSDNDFIDNLSGSNDEDGDWEESGEEKLSNGKDFFAKDTDKSYRRRNDVERVSHRNTERKGKSVIGKDNSASKAEELANGAGEGLKKSVHMKRVT